MKLVACVDTNWAIGNKGNLLFRIPEDMEFFRKLTKNGIVIYGRKTLYTFSNKKPLFNRINIILSRTLDPIVGAFIAHDMNELQDILSGVPAYIEPFVIGGEQIYNLLLPQCTEAYITKVHQTAAEADAFCPNLDKDPAWRGRAIKATNDFTIFKYERIPYGTRN